MEDDAALVARAQAGDPEAFDALVRKHQQQVYAVAVRMLGDSGEAEDAAQDAFVRAYQALGTFRRDAKLSTWLVAIVMNVCRNRRRWWARRKRVIAGSLDAADPDTEAPHLDAADPSPDPSAVAQRQDEARVVLSALQTLSDMDREVIVLRDVQGHSYEEMAEILGCRLGTVKSRINRARWQLRAVLNGAIR